VIRTDERAVADVAAAQRIAAVGAVVLEGPDRTVEADEHIVVA